MAQRLRPVTPGQLPLGLDPSAAGIALELQRLLTETVPNALVIPELGLAARKARVDMAQVGDHLAGFEIKSSRDDLHRLFHQEVAFSATFQQMTLVVATTHLVAAEARIPAWWGLTEVAHGELTIHRPPLPNPSVDPQALAALLWRDEAAALFAAIGGAPRRMTRLQLVDEVAARIESHLLGQAVCDALRARQGWRTAA